MFIKLKMQTDGSEINLNITHITGFGPTAGGNTSSSIRTSDGAVFQVEESTRSIRGYIKKALFAMHTGGGVGGAEKDPSEV